MFDDIQDVFGLEKKTKTIIVKTSKPPKNIKDYEDQLNTYAMFIEKDDLPRTSPEKEGIVGIVFRGEEEVSKIEFSCSIIQQLKKSKKISKSNSSIERLHNEDKNYFSNSVQICGKPNRTLCNWCWYKNYVHFGLAKKIQ